MTACCRRVGRPCPPAGRRFPSATLSGLHSDSVTGTRQDELSHCLEEFTHPLAIHRVPKIRVTDQRAGRFQDGGVDVNRLAVHSESSHRVCLPASMDGEVADQVQPQLAAEGLGRRLNVFRGRHRDGQAFRHANHSACVIPSQRARTEVSNVNLSMLIHDSLTRSDCRDLESGTSSAATSGGNR